MTSWLRRMFRRQRADEARLVVLEQRANKAESQATVARKRAEGVLNAEAARRAERALRRKPQGS